MRFLKRQDLSNGHQETIATVVWSRDGSMLASGGRDRTICVWDPATGIVRQKLVGHRSSIAALSWSPNGRLASAGKDPAIIVWDLNSGVPEYRINGFSPFSALAWLNETEFVSGTAGGTLSFWSSDGSASVDHFETGKTSISELQVVNTDDRQLLVVANSDNCTVWDVAKREVFKSFDPDWSCRNAVVSPNGRLLAAPDDDGNVRVHRFPDFQPVCVLPTEFSDSNGASWNANSTLLAVAGDRGHVDIWDVHDMTRDAQLPCTHTKGKSSCVAFEASGTRLVIRGRSKRSLVVFDSPGNSSGNDRGLSFGRETSEEVNRVPVYSETVNVQPVAGKLKILFLAANPDGTTRLKLDEEFRNIQDRIREAEFRDRIELKIRTALRYRDLSLALMEVKPHIVHFGGHGNDRDELILQDDAGNPHRVSRASLIDLFKTLRDNIRLVVFNACYSKSQAEGVVENIAFAIGMNQAIGDKAAIKFAESLYRAIGFGRTVQEAFDLGQIALRLAGIDEDLTPQILSHPKADPNQTTLI